MKGVGANVCPGAGATAGTAGAGGAGHAMAMNGGSAGAGGTGFCGRPASAVDHVPTQRSVLPLCACMAGERAERTRASAAAAAMLWLRRPQTGSDLRDFMNCYSFGCSAAMPLRVTLCDGWSDLACRAQPLSVVKP